ncbi:hypothetical protein SODALDRAFT_376082 [Sodiomyces alkalinus F11]|uniref:Uncharacterized protein n=1 Tax=Sodiomyces alkalinus (strain CBS 110278 / VKM F-3762 / F11) TaxID=1314773 RepID=A0A3N2Q0J7_SODAK|nr:hypothetical protein SODALDRAFT_376082 [Sodiomyces alkalinus F11]ROT40289.1 hypothetical protein SODALDRAFT_376082 [Sodiomyces alkalinus F11]
MALNCVNESVTLGAPGSPRVLEARSNNGRLLVVPPQAQNDAGSQIHHGSCTIQKALMYTTVGDVDLLDLPRLHLYIVINQSRQSFTTSMGAGIGKLRRVVAADETNSEQTLTRHRRWGDTAADFNVPGPVMQRRLDEQAFPCPNACRHLASLDHKIGPALPARHIPVALRQPRAERKHFNAATSVLVLDRLFAVSESSYPFSSTGPSSRKKARKRDGRDYGEGCVTVGGSFVRSDEFRTPGTSSSTAGNGGRLMLDLRSWVDHDVVIKAGQDEKGGTVSSVSVAATEIEKITVVTCLIMLKKGADTSRSSVPKEEGVDSSIFLLGIPKNTLSYSIRILLDHLTI